MSRSPPTSGQPIQRCLPHPPTSSSHRISGTPSTPRANDSVNCAHKQNPQMSPHKRAGDFTTSRSENPRCREWLFEPTFFVVDHAHQTGVILKNSGGETAGLPAGSAKWRSAAAYDAASAARQSPPGIKLDKYHQKRKREASVKLNRA